MFTSVFLSFDVFYFSLLVVEWKLCAHTASDLQTSKLAQCYTILACCWYQWCEYCRFVIFQLFFLKYLCKAQKAMLTSVLSFDVFYFLSFGCRVETVRTHCKRPTKIKTYTTLYYISVLLVSSVWILSICHFSTVFPETFMRSSKSNVYITVFELRCVLLFLFWLSSGNCAHTLQATYKHQNLHNVILY